MARLVVVSEGMLLGETLELPCPVLPLGRETEKALQNTFLF
jgi:hypothetical protein